MKNLLLTTIFGFITMMGFSQGRLSVSYDAFVGWAKQIKIAGYPFIERELDESDYSAMFSSGPTKLLQIRLGNIEQFKQAQSFAKNAPVYIWKGYEAIFYEFSGVTFLTLKLTDLELTIVFGLNGKATKATLEDIAVKSNFQNLKGSGTTLNTSDIKWPDVIPADLRVSNVETIKSLGPDDSYKDVIEVKAVMSAQLIESLQSILKKYQGELSLTKSAKVDFICSEAESPEQLKENFKNGELVSFMYYIRK